MRKNPDVSNRELGRNWFYSDAVENNIEYIINGLRSGRLQKPQVALAAGLFDLAALEVLKDLIPSYYDYIEDHRYQILPVILEPHLLESSTENYPKLREQFCLRILLALTNIFKEGLPVEMRDLPQNVANWIRNNENKNQGEMLVLHYLDIFDSFQDAPNPLQTRFLRLRPGQTESDRLMVPKDYRLEIAFHLVLTVGIISIEDHPDTWGTPQERMITGFLAALKLRHEYEKYVVPEVSLEEQIAKEVRQQVVPWLLSYS